MSLAIQESLALSRELNSNVDETCFRVTVRIEPPALSEAVSFLLEKRPASYAETCTYSLDFIVRALQELSRYRDSLGRKMAEIDSSIHFLKGDKEDSNEEKIIFLKAVKKRMDQSRKELEKLIGMYRYGEAEARKRQKYFGTVD